MEVNIKRYPPKVRLWILAVVAGLLPALCWPPSFAAPALILAFIPLLILVEKTKKLWPFYIALLVFNGATTWWVGYASIEGAALAILLNSVLMALPPWAASKLLRGRGRAIAWAFGLGLWVGIEHLHTRWEAAWPWLSLGNGFAGFTDLVQWYEWTGVFGGTLWIWLCNGVAFLLCTTPINYGRDKRILIVESYNFEIIKPPKLLFWVGGIILLPILISLGIKASLPNYEEQKDTHNIVLIQPNINPYTEKFDPFGFQGQLDAMINLSKQTSDANTLAVIWPETALWQEMDEGDLGHTVTIDSIRNFCASHPQLDLLAGSSSYEFIVGEKNKTFTSRELENSKGIYYDVFNSAFWLDSSAQVGVYHKQKLVPGVETMPFQSALGFLGGFALELGGTSGSLGNKVKLGTFPLNDGKKLLPVICYESVFGNYVRKGVKNGGQIIAIITNDGWWKNTDGHKQHALYARLRAIENRRMIARCANTGISCFISPDGKVLGRLGWDEEGSLKENIIYESRITLYTRFGDWICYLIWIGCALIIAVKLYQKPRVKILSIPKS